MEPHMPGMERSYTGNERSRNDFDPPVDEEINPRRRAMEGSREDELQLKSMREEDDSQFYRTLTKFLEEETTAVDLPGMVTDEEQEEFTSHGRQEDAAAIPRVSGLRQQVEDDEIPQYVEQFRGHVQGDMVTLEQDDLSQQQMKRFHKRLPAAFQKAESYLVKAVKKCQGEVTAQYGELREWGGEHGLDGQVRC
ncbi:orofacial cleft 1 candidate gene 1 protein homolog [Erpetoichthys calabaricus]|uniref:orofacial cleft 1 candidate gene 1 protein homolog n=1 Tax=Erpetoichthys calabaricus TaxID=27687 RepID=UPI002234C9D0|nr:orofacial cleft 1 candidate gene 1 protein homolog [Erpetoichthys calabaricus]